MTQTSHRPGPDPAAEQGDGTVLLTSAEREVLAPYAPEQMGEAELDAIIDAALAATGATSAQEMGKVMGQVMAKAKGRVDGGVVQAKVRARLGG